MKNLTEQLEAYSNARLPVVIITTCHAQIKGDFIIQDHDNENIFRVYRSGYRVQDIDVKDIGTVSAMVEVFTKSGFDVSADRVENCQSKMGDDW